MKAILLKNFGDEQNLYVGDIDTPDVAENELLIRLSYAGIGQWDIFEREGGYEKLLDRHSELPYILGSEGVGEVVKVGENVTQFNVGDVVNAVQFLNEKGGFYAEYVVVSEDAVYLKPDHLSLEKSSSLSGVGLTAFRGLVDVMNVQQGEDILIFGASGGVGHLAVQIAHSIGAHVFAVASGQDGVDALKGLGIEHVVDGKTVTSEECMSKFNMKSFDHAFLTSGGELAEDLSQNVKSNGSIVYPKGIDEIDSSECKAEVKTYYADIDAELINKFAKWAEKFKPDVIIDQVFDMNDCAAAHQSLEQHYVGKLCFKIE